MKKVQVFACTLLLQMVPRVGVEPTRISPHDFESCASANSAIRGYFIILTQNILV